MYCVHDMVRDLEKHALVNKLLCQLSLQKSSITSWSSKDPINICPPPSFFGYKIDFRKPLSPVVRLRRLLVRRWSCLVSKRFHQHLCQSDTAQPSLGHPFTAVSCTYPLSKRGATVRGFDTSMGNNIWESPNPRHEVRRYGNDACIDKL